MQILPGRRPQWPEKRVRGLIQDHGVQDRVVLVGVRGYYLDTMGAKGVNDRKMYDDAVFLVAPGVFRSFNANTDPGAFRPGIATLLPGVWRYKVGVHGISKPPAKRYLALVQADAVRIVRDGGGEHRGFFGINIHKGSRLSVSSEGCQTIWPGQWGEFLELVRAQLIVQSQSVVPYVLIENTPDMNGVH